MEMIEKGIFLTFDEIKILLFGMGISKIEGVCMPGKEYCEEEILSLLHEMSARGLIKVTEEQRFRLRDDIRIILEMMAFPEETELWQPHGKGGPSFFLYKRDEKVLVSEYFFRRKDTLRLTLFGREELKKWREEFTDDHYRD